jgi:hypothetical protein
VTKALDAVEMSSSAPCLPSYGVTQITNTTGGGNYNPSINADGTRMAFRSDRDLIGAGAFSHLEVFLWTSGSGFTKISNTAANSYSYPSINADGTRFAFTANPNAFGTYLEIVLWTSGSGVTHIAYSNGPDDGSVWSWYPSPINADGTKITFASMHDPIGGNADGNDELFLWTSGLGLTQLTNTTTGGSNGSPSINADGTRIAFASTSDLTGGNPDGNSEIFLASADPTPDPFTLTDVTGVPLSTVQTSNAITVSGITAPAAISIVDGAYELNNSGTWSSSAGTVTNGNTVRVRHTSAATSCTAVNTILTIGDVSDTFTSTTTIGYPLAITKLGSGSGTVTSNPAGIDCGATCAANYTSGIPVTLTATSNPDSTFVGWGGDCGGQGNPCSLTMTSSKTVSATFTAIPPPPPGTYTLTVSPPSNGTVTGSGINCPGDCSEPYSNGTNVILTANPNPDYSFGGWGGNCGGQGNPCTLTMNAAKNVTATFTATPPPPPGTYILTVSPPANGTVTGTSGINCPGTCSATRTAAART